MKLGIIGGWGHFVHVLAETDRMPDVEVVGLAKGMEGEDFADVRERYPSTAEAPEYADAQTLLAESDPDVVVVSTRLDRIAELAIAAATVGCHTVCEKPLAIDRAMLRRLWDAVAANGVQCYTILPNRTHPVLVAARRAIERGLIGQVRLVNARKSYKFGTSRPQWCGERALYGGTLPWVGIHALDFIDAVTSDPPVSVSALHANTSHAALPDCEDAAVAMFQLESGAMASVSVDLLRPDAAGTHGDDWLRIVGDRGVIEAAISRGRCSLITSDGPEIDLPLAEREAYFCPLLRGLHAPGQGAPDDATRRAFALTQAALCARDAADEGGVRMLPDAPWRDGAAGAQSVAPTRA